MREILCRGCPVVLHRSLGTSCGDRQHRCSGSCDAGSAISNCVSYYPAYLAIDESGKDAQNGLPRSPQTDVVTQPEHRYALRLQMHQEAVRLIETDPRLRA